GGGSVFSRDSALAFESCDPLVLQNPNYHAPVFRLPFRRRFIADLPAFAHGTRSQYVSEWNVAILHQKVSDVAGPFRTKLLIYGGTANGRCIAHDLDHEGLNFLGFFR